MKDILGKQVITAPFASQAEGRQEIPLTKQPSGKVSFEEGFGQKYSTPLTGGGSL